MSAQCAANTVVMTGVSSVSCQHGGKDRCQLSVLSTQWKTLVSAQSAANMVAMTGVSSVVKTGVSSVCCQHEAVST